jgi:MoxR-like ATPase
MAGKMREDPNNDKLASFPLDLSPSPVVEEDNSSFKDTLPENTLELVAELAATRKRLLEEIGQVIVGQRDVLDLILISLFAGGHCVMTGVPGLAKTLIVSSLSKTLSLGFKRIQFTPDLMPTDITGTMVLAEGEDQRQRSFVFQSGPIFTNMLLADEINRTPPKTQAALLEGMQEKSVTVGGVTHPLPSPFLVLATQNPIEQEGTYTLPEAQLDRFLFMINVDYPSLDEEEEILIKTTLDSLPSLDSMITSEQIVQFQRLVRQVPVSRYVANYAARLARATRPKDPLAPDFIPKWVQWGCGPRAGQALLLAAKAHVLLSGRFNVSVSDIRAFVHPVFRHRFGLTFTAASEGYDTDTIIDWLLKSVPVIFDEEKKPTLMGRVRVLLRRKKTKNR